MEQQRDRARSASKFAASTEGAIRTEAESVFCGYEGTEGSGTVVALYRDGEPVDALSAGEEGAVILSSTPFYAESGGQIGDTGILAESGKLFQVVDTQKNGSAIVHYGAVEEGELQVGDSLDAIVDEERRQAIRLNHSATHLMHAALRNVLGEHVQQKGSLVAPDRLRFDFSHYEALTPEQIAEIEALVNEEIRRNVVADTRLMSYDDAMQSGAMALFGEKYGDKVRVLRFGDFSIELCGGTHVERTGDIGVFKITSEGGIASGVRRIEAVTGKSALEWIDSREQTLAAVAGLLKSNPDQAAARVEQLLQQNKGLQKRLATARHALLTGEGSDQEDEIQEIAGIKVLAARLHDMDASLLREAVDRAKDKLQNAVIVLGTVEDGKVLLAAGVTKNNVDRIRAGDLIKPVAEKVGGKGGGRPDFAQAGGSKPEALDEALGAVSDWVAQQLA